MKNILILFTFSLCVNLYAISVEMTEKANINTAIDMMYREKFDDALNILNSIKDSYPDHPIGNFFLGFYYNFLAAFYETNKFDSKIVLYYDLAEKKSRFHLKYDPEDPWFNYYAGASMINRGYLLGKNGERFSALKKTYKGISYIEKALEQNSDLGDALMLLGAYRFYKASLFSWIFDRRDSAVKILKESIKKSHFSEFAARSALGWVLIDYKKYKEAEKVADAALKKYPSSHLFLFLKARALYEMQNYEEAILIYKKIESILNSFEITYSQKDIFNTYYFLCMSYNEINNNENVNKYLKVSETLKLSISEKKELKNRIADLKKIKRSKEG